MLKKLRKSSGTVTLVLIGVAALAGCSDEKARRLRLAGRLPRRLGQQARGLHAFDRPEAREPRLLLRPDVRGRRLPGGAQLGRLPGQLLGVARFRLQPLDRQHRRQLVARRLRLLGPLLVEQLIGARRAGRASRLAAQGRGPGLPLPHDGRRVLGRARVLPLHRRGGRPAGGGHRRAAGALHRGRGQGDRVGRLRALPHPGAVPPAHSRLLGRRRALALRTLRLLLGRHTASRKMLEYNADTPTALLEASVVQWYWLKDVFPDADQFNSLHEKLIERWKRDRREGPRQPRSCTSPA